MKEAITTKYKSTQGLVPTFQLGSVPIDGIFVSEVLDIIMGGYFPFGVSPLDHRVLWIKIKINSVFGHNFY